MKTKNASNGIRFNGGRFLRLWSELAQGVFPFIMDEVGELDDDHRLFVAVCEAVIDPKEFEYAKWCGNGRPKADRLSMFKAYILKMTLNLKGDKELVGCSADAPRTPRTGGLLLTTLLLLGFQTIHLPLPFRKESGLTCTPEAQKTRFAPVLFFFRLFTAYFGHIAPLFVPSHNHHSPSH